MEKRRIIIDTDPGIDDALAILLALASPEVELEALTIVNGNCSTEQGLQNALAVLDLAQAPHIPVARGAERPLVQPLLLAPETHGNMGMGYAQLPVSSRESASISAAGLLIERCLASPGEITLVAIGPLTNLALALSLEPRLAKAIRELYIMGGAIRHPGNTTALAEFNTYCDPHAAHIVFHADIPTTLVPLDVTYQVVLTPADVEALLEMPSPLPRFIADATRFYMEFHHDYQQIDGCVINDPLALAVLFRPDLVETQQLYVDVDLSGGVSMGKTFADFYRMGSRPPNMKVALQVRGRDFVEFFLERMRRLARRIGD